MRRKSLRTTHPTKMRKAGISLTTVQEARFTSSLNSRMGTQWRCQRTILCEQMSRILHRTGLKSGLSQFPMTKLMEVWQPIWTSSRNVIVGKLFLRIRETSFRIRIICKRFESRRSSATSWASQPTTRETLNHVYHRKGSQITRLRTLQSNRPTRLYFKRSNQMETTNVLKFRLEANQAMPDSLKKARRPSLMCLTRLPSSRLSLVATWLTLQRVRPTCTALRPWERWWRRSCFSEAT